MELSHQSSKLVVVCNDASGVLDVMDATEIPRQHRASLVASRSSLHQQRRHAMPCTAGRPPRVKYISMAIQLNRGLRPEQQAPLSVLAQTRAANAPTCMHAYNWLAIFGKQAFAVVAGRGQELPNRNRPGCPEGS